jgi:hypothetical protein
LCHLEAGPRTPDLVYYAAIAGVPHQLLQQDPTNPFSPQKPVLTDADWTRILGNDPEHYDFSGADFHMIESTQDRTASSTDPSSTVWANHSTCPTGASDDCDPINGREHATNAGELQFSCTYPLLTVNNTTITAFQKDCAVPGPGGPYAGACDCAPGSPDAETQLCQSSGIGKYTTVQINAKAYPPVREMLIAKAMSKSTFGDQGIVSSICPISLDIGQTVAQAQQDPLFGFNPAMNAIVDRFRGGESHCVTYDLSRYASDAGSPGALSCTMFVQLPVGSPGTCKNPGATCTRYGLVGPDVVLPGQSTPVMTHSLLATFCDELESRYLADGGKQAFAGDPASTPVCAMPQLILDPKDTTDCTHSTAPGWCYEQGAAAQSIGCPSTFAFSRYMPPNHTVSYLECMTP